MDNNARFKAHQSETTKGRSSAMANGWQMTLRFQWFGSAIPKDHYSEHTLS